MTNSKKYTPSQREQDFLDTVESPRYERESLNGLKPFLENRVAEDVKGFYSPAELDALAKLEGTERDVEHRMPVKMTRHSSNW
jgi:hypothetical protein